MQTIRVIATLVPALDADFFTDVRGVKESVSVFMKSQKTGFAGPYMLENLYLDEIIRFMEADAYYVIRHDPARRADREFTFKLILRPANGDDFRWSPRYPRWFRIYWLRLDAQRIQGPLYFMPGTDIQEFSKQLQAGQLYVPNEKQDFIAWQASSAAS